MKTFTVNTALNSAIISDENKSPIAQFYKTFNPHFERDAELACDALNLFQERGESFDLQATIAEQKN